MPSTDDELKKAYKAFKKRMKLTRRRPEPGDTHRNRRFPAPFEQVLEMRGQRDRIIAPWCQAKERPNSEATKASVVTALWTSESPIEISLRSGGVHLSKGSTVVGFLINHESFRACYNDPGVFLGFHWPDFNRN